MSEVPPQVSSSIIAGPQPSDFINNGEPPRAARCGGGAF